MDILLLLRITDTVIIICAILITLRELFFRHRLYGSLENAEDSTYIRLLLLSVMVYIVWTIKNKLFLTGIILVILMNLWTEILITRYVVNKAYMDYLNAIEKPEFPEEVPLRPDLAGLPFFSLTEKNFEKILLRFNILDKEDIDYIIRRSKDYEENRRGR